VRCGKVFEVYPNGKYPIKEECVYHWGKAWKKKSKPYCQFSFMCVKQSHFLFCNAMKLNLEFEFNFTMISRIFKVCHGASIGLLISLPPKNLCFSENKIIFISFLVAGSWETRYTCCQGDLAAEGCQVAKVIYTDCD
jgi:hypothetical protein